MDSRIVCDLQKTFGITVEEYTAVEGGWLNEKWCVTSEKGDVLVKHFSNTRYGSTKIQGLEDALQRQIVLQQQGLSTPRIWQASGKAIRVVDDDLRYMVMDFIPGQILSSKSIANRQLQDLGSVCAWMHKAFSKIPCENVPFDTPDLLSALWANYHECCEDTKTFSDPVFQKAVAQQVPILEYLEREPGFFKKLLRGIAHADFSADNLLFDKKGVAAVLDFDRNRVTYIWQDIGRALLSFALVGETINWDRVAAFVEGYNTELPFTMEDAIHALRLSWCIEVLWWIKPAYFIERRDKVVRFREELVWLTNNWLTLQC